METRDANVGEGLRMAATRPTSSRGVALRTSGQNVTPNPPWLMPTSTITPTAKDGVQQTNQRCRRVQILQEEKDVQGVIGSYAQHGHEQSEEQCTYNTVAEDKAKPLPKF